MVRTALAGLLLLGAGLTACAANGFPPSTSGSTGASTTGQSPTGSASGGGFDGGTGCTGSVCSTSADCCVGDQCSQFTLTCCLDDGQGCSADTDCCSAYCNPALMRCLILGGASTTTTGAGATTSASAGSTTGASTSTSSGTASSTSGGSPSTTSGGTTSSGTSSTGGSGGGPAFDFQWTFGLNQSCERAGVAWISVALTSPTPGTPGPTALFPCRDPSGNEAALVRTPTGAFGTVGYTIVAYDGVNLTTLGTLSGTANAPLTGTAPVAVTVPVNPSGGSQLNVDWSFLGASCASAGVSGFSVQLTDTKNAALSINQQVLCDAGSLGLSVSGYAPGAYPVTLSAGGTNLAPATGSLVANGSTPAILLADLEPSTGVTGASSATIDFSFGGQSCAAAGLDTVSLQLANPNNGAAIGTPVSLPCGDAGVAYTFSGITPGTAMLWLEGSSQGVTQQLATPQLVISPGVTSQYTVIGNLGP